MLKLKLRNEIILIILKITLVMEGKWKKHWNATTDYRLHALHNAYIPTRSSFVQKVRDTIYFRVIKIQVTLKYMYTLSGIQHAIRLHWLTWLLPVNGSIKKLQQWTTHVVIMRRRMLEIVCTDTQFWLSPATWPDWLACRVDHLHQSRRAISMASDRH